MTNCICHIEQRVAGKGCAQPTDEVCTYFSPWAKQFIEMGMGREATAGEAVEAQERRGGDMGLVHIGRNVQWGMHAICECCPCYCFMLRAINEVGRKTAAAKSSFVPFIHLESCNVAGSALESAR